jgi:predicted aconitase
MNRDPQKNVTSMVLTPDQQALLDGKAGRSARKAMEILATLGRIYGARRMVPVTSVQIAGVSYDNLGEAGLEFLNEMASGGGKAFVLATLNPAGMDVENWQALGISPEFARNQQRVIEAFARMGVVTTCTCTPYLSGNLPHFCEHIAWAESSAVCFANAVIGARTNREGGPSALAAALTGFTPEYGYHLEEKRLPGVTIEVSARLEGTDDFGALGRAAGEKLEALAKKEVPYIRGISQASVDQLKTFCASIATYGGCALFHMEGITPEAGQCRPPEAVIHISQEDLDQAKAAMSDASPEEVDFVSLGCPHLSIAEVSRLAALLEGKRVTKEFWVTTSRPVKHIADRMGYTQAIETSGARFAVDTCCVVAPIAGRFRAMATDSAKACYYASSKNRFKTLLCSMEDVVAGAVEVVR